VYCASVACPVRVGAPRVLVTSPTDQQIAAIAVGADTLYWGTYPNQTPGAILSSPLAGGPSTLIVSNVIVSALYLDGSTLYYVTNDRTGMSSLFAIPATGGTALLIATGPELGSITSDASAIYFGQQVSGNSRILRADRTGFAVTPLVEVAGTLWGFAIDDANVYWAVYSKGGMLNRRALAGGDTTTLRASGSPITFPITDGDDIDFVEGINTPDVCQSSVWAVPKAGGTPRSITPGTSGIDAGPLVRDDTHVYWGRQSYRGALLRTVKGLTPEILATDQDAVASLVLGPSDIYWVATNGSAYEVRTLPK
jgi:hypothetical protein